MEPTKALAVSHADSRDSDEAAARQRSTGSAETAAARKETAKMAQGRGRGQTLPAWMTQGGNDAALDSMLASASQAAA